LLEWKLNLSPNLCVLGNSQLDNIFFKFYIHGTAHHLSVLNKPTRCSWVVNFISIVDYSTCFGRFLHPSSGV